MSNGASCFINRSSVPFKDDFYLRFRGKENDPQRLDSGSPEGGYLGLEERNREAIGKGMGIKKRGQYM